MQSRRKSSRIARRRVQQLKEQTNDNHIQSSSAHESSHSRLAICPHALRDGYRRQYLHTAAPENRFANLGSLVVLADPNTVLTGTNGAPAKVNVSIRNGSIMINNNTAIPVGTLVWNVEAVE